jgi:hypothetical protein
MAFYKKKEPQHMSARSKKQTKKPITPELQAPQKAYEEYQQRRQEFHAVAERMKENLKNITNKCKI